MAIEPIAGSLAGQSVASAHLTRHDTQLGGTITVQSANTADLKGLQKIVGALAAIVVIAAASLTRYDTQLVGSLAVQAGADAALQEWNYIAGTADGQSTASAHLTRHDTQLVGTVDGQSGADAALQEWNYIAGTVDGQSGADAHLTRFDTQLVGTVIAVQSTADAIIKSTQMIIGETVVGLSSVPTAKLTRFDTQLVSGVDAISGLSGTLALLSEWNHLKGTADAETTTYGKITRCGLYMKNPMFRGLLGPLWGW